MSEASTSLLALSLLDFNRLKLEFTDIYQKLIENAAIQIEKVIQLKLIAIKKCAKQLSEYNATHKNDEQDSDNPFE